MSRHKIQDRSQYQIPFRLTDLSTVISLPQDTTTGDLIASNLCDPFGSILEVPRKKAEDHYLWVSDLASAFEMYVHARDHSAELILGAKNRRWEDSVIHLEHALESDDPHYGMPPTSVVDASQGKFDMRVFEEARTKISRVSQEVENYLEKTRPGRRRRFSSEEGDFQMDRRYDLYPFAATSRQEALHIPKLNVVVNTSFSWQIPEKFIANHCALSWAIVDMFEKQGILCSVYSSYFAQHLSPNIKKLQCIFELKKHDSYVTPINLARGMCSAFYRRIGFLTFVRVAALLGHQAVSGLGSPDNQEREPLLKNGVLLLTGRITTQIESLGPEKGSKWLFDEMKPGLLEMGLK